MLNVYVLSAEWGSNDQWGWEFCPLYMRRRNAVLQGVSTILSPIYEKKQVGKYYTMNVDTVVDEWGQILAGNNALRRIVYTEALKAAFTAGRLNTRALAHKLYKTTEHKVERKVRRYIKELVDKKILQKRRDGFGGSWYYEPTDWFRALLIETYKVLRRL